MSFPISPLIELHRIHQQLSDLRDRIERGPKQIRAHSANVTTAEGKVAQSKTELQSTRMIADQKQLQLKSGEAKIEDLKTKLNASQSNREYQALKDQIAASEMASSVLQDEILEALEKIDLVKRNVVDNEQHLVKSKEELAKVEAAVKEQAAMLQSEFNRVEVNLRESEAGLPTEWRDPYQRVVKSKGADAMAAVENESCGGCYQQLTQNQLSDMRMNKIVFCKTCGRLMYLPEDRGQSLRKS